MTVRTKHYSSRVLLETRTPTITVMADSEGNAKNCAVLTLILAAESMMDDTECLVASKLASDKADAVIQSCLPTTTERIGSTSGRKWLVERNEQDWLFRYAMSTDFLTSPDWRSMFRIPYDLFLTIADKIRPEVQRSPTNMRLPIPSEKKLAAFLMIASNATYRRVASQLGMGASTVLVCVLEVSRVICSSYSDSVQLPTTTSQIASLMEGFKCIAGLPYCVGAIDGTHIPWKNCPVEQYYEYRCYKKFQSFIMLALASSDRRIIYAALGRQVS